MKRARVFFAVAMASSWSFFACDAIVGVTDVRLAPEAGAIDAPDDQTTIDQGLPDTPSTPTSGFELALGELHTCAQKADGTVACWGDESKGQTGTGVDGGSLTQPTPTGVSDAIHVAAGKSHTCVIHRGGAVSCWGDDTAGQIGDGMTNTQAPFPVDVGGLGDAIAIGAGATSTCAVKSDGSAVCWGDNTTGQLGTGGKIASTKPTPVAMLTNLASISCGDQHACAVTRDGKVSCWGAGSSGQLGNNGVAESDFPALVALDGVMVVAAASRSTCALRTNGEVHCWGANDLGQTGSGAANAVPVVAPVQIPGLDAIALAASANHACAVRRSGGVTCWGEGTRGALGDGESRDAGVPEVTPVDVTGITRGTSVGVGGLHSCATVTSGGILCWGANDRGQLGNGSTLDLLTPESAVGYP